MLIEFQVENFRSIKERQLFSMVADATAEHRERNTFETPLHGFGRLVRSAVLYGPNAAGKTNFLLAVKFMKDFVVGSAVSSSATFPYSPFKLSSGKPRVSEFQITLVQDQVRYDYGFALGPERVEREWLVEYVFSGSRTRGRALFERTWEVKKKSYTWKFSPYLKGQRSVWSEATRPDALFLSTAIQLNSTQLRPVFDWFQKRLVIIAGEVQMNESLTIKLLEQPDGKQRLLPFLREADLGIADLEVKREPVPAGGVVFGKNTPMLVHAPERNAADMVTVTLSHRSDDGKSAIGFDFSDESSGTQILFKTAGAWLNVLANGEVLLFDEIDKNMHPALLRFLIQRFHSTKINTSNAQLICSTHNTSILNQSLFRRDQIWFVEKVQNGSSKLYPLTDFGPRSDEVLETWYMRGRYGAQPMLPDVV